MTTETQNTMDAGSRSNRTMEIMCTPVLTYPEGGGYGANVTYSLVRGTGGMNGKVNGNSRVDSRGNINLTQMPDTPGFNDNVDIIITLNTSELIDRNGDPTAGRWALPAEGPTWYPNGDHVGCCWFCAYDATKSPPYDPTKPITIPGMTAALVPPVSATSPVKIQDDVADNGPSYGFCLGLILPDVTASPYFITLDPVLTSKTMGSNAFMLKE